MVFNDAGGNTQAEARTFREPAMGGLQLGKPLEQVTESEWNSIIAVNLTGTFFFAQAVAPAMKAARTGRIVNISSGAGLAASLTGIQSYSAAKAGQINLTRQTTVSNDRSGRVSGMHWF